jgi:hypothetical protein
MTQEEIEDAERHRVAQGFIALAQLAATFGYVMMISTPPQITDAPGGQEFHESAD